MTSRTLKTTGDGAVDEDVYCLACGYNLRGGFGDPVRCSECGESNDRAALAIPAPILRKALRRMETTPTVCVALVALFLFVTGVAVFGNAFLVYDSSTYWRLAATSLVCAAAWPFACWRVRSSYNGRPGWRGVLVRFHLAGLLCCMWYPLLLGCALAMEVSGTAPTRGFAWMVLVVSGVFFVWGLRVYFAVRRRMARLQRGAAVEIAQRMLQRARSRSSRS